MKSRRVTGIITAAAIAGALIAPAAIAVADTGQERTQALGNKSLAAALTAHGNGKFDRNWNDYDIVTQAVLAVLEAKPDSPVKVLTRGGVRLTVFIPDDRSFRKLARDLTGSAPRTEKATFNALVGAVGVDAIEQVLQYHVIPGVRVTAKKALRSNGATLDTALPGAGVTVTVADKKVPLIVLTDNDPDDVDPIVDPGALNLNQGNKQIAHGIIFVLRPANL